LLEDGDRHGNEVALEVRVLSKIVTSFCMGDIRF
jgi:hypothetical protein